MMKFIASTIMLLILFVGCNSQNKQKENIDWHVYENIGDSILNTITTNDVKLFAEVEKGIYKQVFDIDKWNEEYISFINVIDAAEVKIYIEVPYCESGDWKNEYIYIFDELGKLKLLIRKSSFFNSVCTDGVLTEKEIFAIESDELKKKKHEFFDENNNAINDTTNCIFNYRFEYPVYLNYYELPVLK